MYIVKNANNWKAINIKWVSKLLLPLKKYPQLSFQKSFSNMSVHIHTRFLFLIDDKRDFLIHAGLYPASQANSMAFTSPAAGHHCIDGSGLCEMALVVALFPQIMFPWPPSDINLWILHECLHEINFWQGYHWAKKSEHFQVCYILPNWPLTKLYLFRFLQITLRKQTELKKNHLWLLWQGRFRSVPRCSVGEDVGKGPPPYVVFPMLIVDLERPVPWPLWCPLATFPVLFLSLVSLRLSFCSQDQVFAQMFYQTKANHVSSF